jgi:hypothetical protein
MRDGDFTAWLRTGASVVAAAADPIPAAAVRRRGDRRRRRNAVLSGMLAFVLGAGGGGFAYASVDRPGSGGPIGASASGHAFAGPSAARPGIVAVTTAGAVEVLNPVTGIATAVLAPSQDAIGDEIAVSPSGQTVYFAVRHGCTDDIESVPVAGGTPVVVAHGLLPAISPDGTKLAFVREPFGAGGAPRYGCSGASANAGGQVTVVVRNLASGAQTTYPAPPAASTSPTPVSHLSWAADGKQLLVSVGAGQDDEGWGLAVIDTATAGYYLPADWTPQTPGVPVASSAAAGSYYREGVYLPDGNLFVSQVCCSGVPVQITSSLLLEVTPSGSLVHQVAIGFTNRDHSSLAVDPSGRWLLYLSGQDLFISAAGAPPAELTSGLIAAAWLPS